MRFLFVLSVFLVPCEFVFVTDSPASRSLETEAIRRGSDRDEIFLATKKCSDIPRDEGESDRGACADYCKALEEKFSDGECLDGICRCKLDIADILQSIMEKNRDRGKPRRPEYSTKAGRNPQIRQGAKCKNLIRFGAQAGTENHKGCGVHCRLLNPENKDGHCVEGICQCSRKIVEKRPTTFKSPEEDGEEEEAEEKEVNDSEEDAEDGGLKNEEEPVSEREDLPLKKCDAGRPEICSVHCRRLGKKSSSAICIKGTCQCGMGRILSTPQSTLNRHALLTETISRKEKKCDHRRRSVNEDVCRAHCQAFSKDHTQGRCVDGVCQCGYAVFEVEAEAEEEPVVVTVRPTETTSEDSSSSRPYTTTEETRKTTKRLRGSRRRERNQTQS